VRRGAEGANKNCIYDTLKNSFRQHFFGLNLEFPLDQGLHDIGNSSPASQKGITMVGVLVCVCVCVFRGGGWVGLSVCVYKKKWQQNDE